MTEDLVHSMIPEKSIETTKLKRDTVKNNAIFKPLEVVKRCLYSHTFPGLEFSVSSMIRRILLYILKFWLMTSKIWVVLINSAIISFDPYYQLQWLKTHLKDLFLDVKKL